MAGWLGTQQPPSGRVDHSDHGMQTLHLVRRSRGAAVWLTVGIATVSFVLSFTSLRGLAAMSAWPGWPSWLWPLIIDGTIILATLGIVSLAPYRDHFLNRVFLWVVLSAAALVSVGGNGLHAWLSTAQLGGLLPERANHQTRPRPALPLRNPSRAVAARDWSPAAGRATPRHREQNLGRGARCAGSGGSRRALSNSWRQRGEQWRQAARGGERTVA